MACPETEASKNLDSPQFIEKLLAVRPRNAQVKWQEMEFTAFFHFGINTFTDREWGEGNEDITLFNPSQLNTDQWCEALVKAGIRGCLYTAKHHDGFCSFHTQHTEHSVKNTPFGRDVLKELSESCKKYGLKLGVYLSPWDRHEERYGQGKAYDDFFCAQLTELLTNYGPLYSVWFDGACGEGSNGKKQFYDWERYYKTIYDIQPEAVISVCGPDVRWCGNEAGQCRKAEWSVVSDRLRDTERISEESQKEDSAEFREKAFDYTDDNLGSRELLAKEEKLIWFPAEVDVSIRPGWFYHKPEDDKVRSLENLKEIYLGSVGGNAMMLLNIPPDTRGLIADNDCRRLEELGSWINSTFGKAAEGSIMADSEGEGHPIDNCLEPSRNAYWKGESPSAVITLTPKEEKAFTYLTIMEHIEDSQRIESFSVYGVYEGGRTLLYEGQTVGYKRICPLKHMKVKQVVIEITGCRGEPHLDFVGLYS